MMKFKKLFIFLAGFLILIKSSVYAAFSVRPVFIEENLQPGGVKIDTVLIKNIDTNITHDYILNVYGKISNFTVISYHEFELKGGESKPVKLYFIIPSNAKSGLYDGYLSITEKTGNNTITKQVYIRLIISQWIFKTDRWITTPAILYVGNYKFNVTMLENGAAVKVNGVVIYPGESKVFYNNVRLTLLEVDYQNKRAYFKIESKLSNPSIVIQNINTFQSTSGSGGVQLYPSMVTKRLQQGIKSSSIILYFYNGLDRSIRIERVDVSGDVFEFEDGTSEPVSGYKLPIQNPILQPGDQIPIIIKLSTTKIDPGRYTVTVTVTYREGNVLRYKTAILNIIVFKSQNQAINEINIKMPNKIELNKEFKITVNNIDGYDVEVVPSNKKCVIGSYSINNGVYEYDGKVTCNNVSTLTLTVNVKKYNSIVKSISKQYIIEKPKTHYNLIVNINPPNPKPGDLVKIYAMDENGNIIKDATILVNGVPESSFVAKPLTTYVITVTAPGYGKVTKTIKVPGKLMRVVITPPNPKVGDNVTINVYDASNGEVLQDVKIFVNGKIINDNHFKLDHPGIYNIKVTANGYQPIVRSINVVQPLEVNISTNKIVVGKTIYATSNKPIIWKVVYINPKTNQEEEVYSTTTPTKTFSYVPSKPGKYKILAGSKTYYVEVSSRSITLPLYYLLIPILLVLFILLIRKRLKLKKVRKGVTKKSIIRPPLPPEGVGFPAQKVSEDIEKEVKEE